MFLPCSDQHNTLPEQPVVLGAHFEQLLDEFVEYAIGLQSKVEAEGEHLPVPPAMHQWGLLAASQHLKNHMASTCNTSTWHCSGTRSVVLALTETTLVACY
jgi:hypothetical protein